MAQERKVKRREGNEIEFSRIVAFSDGVFAIAITLLVLAINVPDHLRDESLAEALWKQRDDMLAYAMLWMAAYARQAGLTTIDAASHHEQRYRSLYITAVFLAAIPVAFVAPGIAPFMWLALFFDPTARLASSQPPP